MPHPTPPISVPLPVAALPPERVCSVSGCGREVDARGWCPTHYRRWRVTGSPLPGDAATKIANGAGQPGAVVPWAYRDTGCRIDDCSRPAEARGLCTTHYTRWKRHGDPTVGGWRNANQDCTVEGCAAEAKARGWCFKHYQRWQAYGDPTALTRREPGSPRPTCAEPGCDRTVRARGLCSTHYGRAQRDGTLPPRADNTPAPTSPDPADP